MPLKHGNYKRPEYVVWERMRSRCNSTTDKRYASYGGRGILVCEAWNDFNTFLADMGERPTGYTLERMNNDLGYSKDNCRWATRQEQNNNTQRSLHVEFESTSLTLRQWAEKLSLPYASIWYRYSKGVRPPELFLPIGSTGNKTIRRRA